MPEVAGSQFWAVGGLTDFSNAKKKSLQESCRTGTRIVVMKLICSLCQCECDGHTVHKLCQRRLTADWLAPWERDCSRMHSKVSSDWQPSYIKTKRPVLEKFKMAGYFPDSPCTPYYLLSRKFKTNWTNSLAIKVFLTAYSRDSRFLWNVDKHLPTHRRITFMSLRTLISIVMFK